MVMLALCLYAVPMALAGMGGGKGGGMGNGSGMGHGRGMGGGMGGGHDMMKANFMVTGTVSPDFVVPDPLDPEAELTLTLTVKRANRALKDLVGTDVDFTVPADVRVMVRGMGAADLSFVSAGDAVKLMGKAVTTTDGAGATVTTYEVTRIMLY
jgi:hypothetical protein